MSTDTERRGAVPFTDMEPTFCWCACSILFPPKGAAGTVQEQSRYTIHLDQAAATGTVCLLSFPEEPWLCQNPQSLHASKFVGCSGRREVHVV